MQLQAKELRNDHETLDNSVTRFKDDVMAFRTDVFGTLRNTKDDLQE